MIDGFEIVVCSYMVGCKKAVQIGDGPIYVSPAMWDLLSHAQGPTLERLLGGIPLLRLPAFDPLSLPSIFRFLRS